MKTIEPISIWDKGVSKQATILNAYAINLTLNTSATFWYGLMSDNLESLAQGNLTMSGEEYQLWDVDDFAWEFIGHSLNLVITGDYVKPDIIISEPISEPVSEPISELEVVVEEVIEPVVTPEVDPEI